MNISLGSGVENKVRIVMADDDPDDRLLLQEALGEIRFSNPVDYVEDGQQLLDYLYRERNYSALNSTPLPGLILLDLNMPRMDGHEALDKIKADPTLKSIPVVILTTSDAEKDVLRSYNMGVNSFITKPVTFDNLIEAVKTITEYWFQIVRLP